METWQDISGQTCFRHSLEAENHELFFKLQESLIEQLDLSRELKEEELEELKEEGIIKHIGLSTHNTDIALLAAENPEIELLMFSITPAYAMFPPTEVIEDYSADAKYTAFCASKMNEEHSKLVSIAGKCCESGDMITWNTPMPESLKKGDTLAVLTTGAYNYSMASNYNRNPVPALVLAKNGESCLAVKRQTYENIMINDVLPEHLK